MRAILTVSSTVALSMLSFYSLAHAQNREKITAQAEMVCTRMGSTTQAQHLERLDMIIEFGITDPTVADLTKNLIEMEFMLFGNTGMEIDGCVEHLLTGLDLNNTME